MFRVPSPQRKGRGLGAPPLSIPLHIAKVHHPLLLVITTNSVEVKGLQLGAKPGSAHLIPAAARRAVFSACAASAGCRLRDSYLLGLPEVSAKLVPFRRSANFILAPSMPPPAPASVDRNCEGGESESRVWPPRGGSGCDLGHMKPNSLRTGGRKISTCRPSRASPAWCLARQTPSFHMKSSLYIPWSPEEGGHLKRLVCEQQSSDDERCCCEVSSSKASTQNVPASDARAFSLMPKQP